MNNDTAINEIQKAIDEIRHNGEQHHAEFVQSNGELVIYGLEMALDILNSVEPKPCDDTISRQGAIRNERTMGRIEEWWKKVCIKHNCRYYIHRDYPQWSYCICPNNCILVDKPKAESEEV